MKLRHIFAALILPALFCTSPTALAGQSDAGTAEQDAAVRAGVEDLIRQSGAEVAVAFRSLDGSKEFFINADKEYPAMDQWVEIPVMAELNAEVDARSITLDDTLVVQNSFRSAADGRVYHLDPRRDPDAGLYKQIGKPVSVGELETRMMKQNSYLATNLLIQMLGISQIDARLADLHASGIELRHGFQDTKAESAGKRNAVSARAMMEVLWSLATNNAISAEASKEMVGLLANSRTATSGPFAARPPSDPAGNNDQESLIVYGARSAALAVVVRGGKTEGASAALIAKISHQLSGVN